MVCGLINYLFESSIWCLGSGEKSKQRKQMTGTFYQVIISAKCILGFPLWTKNLEKVFGEGLWFENKEVFWQTCDICEWHVLAVVSSIA